MLVSLVAMLVLALLDRSRPAAAGRDGAAKDQTARQGIPSPLTPLPRGEGDRSRESRSRFAALLFVGSLTLLVLLDQHRFQPWAYQFAIVAIVLAFAPAERAASLLRVLTVGIYFWSAVSKFDYTFLHGLGPELLRGLLSALHLEPRWMRPEAAVAIAWAFPLDELAIALLLAIRKTRTIGLFAAIVMHALLIATLGPFGLNHSTGVLLWNVYFIGQNLLLFRRPAGGWRATAGIRARDRFRDILLGSAPVARSAGIAHVAVFVAVWLPILEPFGVLDQWPAWAVYAPSAERVMIMIVPEQEDSRSLPSTLRTYFPDPTGPFYAGDARPDLWSQDALATPLYPEERFSVGLAIALADRFNVPALVVVNSRADRFTGARSAEVYADEQLREYADSFYLNALPRKLGGW